MWNISTLQWLCRWWPLVVQTSSSSCAWNTKNKVLSKRHGSSTERLSSEAKHGTAFQGEWAGLFWRRSKQDTASSGQLYKPCYIIPTAVSARNPVAVCRSQFHSRLRNVPFLKVFPSIYRLLAIISWNLTTQCLAAVTGSVVLGSAAD